MMSKETQETVFGMILDDKAVVRPLSEIDEVLKAGNYYLSVCNVDPERPVFFYRCDENHDTTIWFDEKYEDVEGVTC